MLYHRWISDRLHQRAFELLMERKNWAASPSISIWRVMGETWTRSQEGGRFARLKLVALLLQMKLYSQVIFPRLLDLSMSSEFLTAYRREVLDRATGQVMEIGFGTGLNLPYYPKSVEKLTAIDINPGMTAIANRRVARAPFPVERITLDGESLPMADESFDTVVSTWTLCSITNVAQALQEARRVLKPDGELLFIEHGLSPDRTVENWQQRLNGVQKTLGDGCNINRNIAQLIEDARFSISQLNCFYAKRVPKILGYFYKGIAVKSCE